MVFIKNNMELNNKKKTKTNINLHIASEDQENKIAMRTILELSCILLALFIILKSGDIKGSWGDSRSGYLVNPWYYTDVLLTRVATD